MPPISLLTQDPESNFLFRWSHCSHHLLPWTPFAECYRYVLLLAFPANFHYLSCSFHLSYVFLRFSLFCHVPSFPFYIVLHVYVETVCGAHKFASAAIVIRPSLSNFGVLYSIPFFHSQVFIIFYYLFTSPSPHGGINTYKFGVQIEYFRYLTYSR